VFHLRVCEAGRTPPHLRITGLGSTCLFFKSSLPNLEENFSKGTGEARGPEKHGDRRSTWTLVIRARLRSPTFVVTGRKLGGPRKFRQMSLELSNFTEIQAHLGFLQSTFNLTDANPVKPTNEAKSSIAVSYTYQDAYLHQGPKDLLYSK
jgi:hypothetical protein